MLNNKGHIHLTILGIIFLIATVAGAYYLGTTKNTSVTLTEKVEKTPPPEQSPQPTPAKITYTPSPTITPTNSPKPDKTNNPNAPTSIKVTSPNGGETFKVGDTIHVTWDSNNLTKSGSCIVKLAYDGGGYSNAWVPVNTPNGFFDWKITSDSAGKQTKIDMECYDSTSNRVADQSDNFFTINN